MTQGPLSSENGPNPSPTAILQRPLDELKPRGRGKSKGTTTICSYSLPYPQQILHFYNIELKNPVQVPAGAILELRITLPKPNRRGR